MRKKDKKNNIYEQNLELIADHYKHERFDEAKALVDEELGMPYTPSDYLLKFKHWRNQLAAEEKLRQSAKTRNKEELLELLGSSRHEELLEAITALHSYVLKAEDLDVIAEFLAKKQVPRVFRALLAQVLIDQKVDKVFAYDCEGNETFNPCELRTLKTDGTFAKTLTRLDELFVKEPSSLEFATQYCVFYFMYVFPASPAFEPAEIAERVFAYTKGALSNEPAIDEPVANTIGAAIRQNTGVNEA